MLIVNCPILDRANTAGGGELSKNQGFISTSDVNNELISSKLPDPLIRRELKKYKLWSFCSTALKSRDFTILLLVKVVC